MKWAARVEVRLNNLEQKGQSMAKTKRKTPPRNANGRFKKRKK